MSISLKPPICMRCKSNKVHTSGSYYKNDVVVAWHYRCKCGWLKKWGKYPTINWKDIIHENN